MYLKHLHNGSTFSWTQLSFPRKQTKQKKPHVMITWTFHYPLATKFLLLRSVGMFNDKNYCTCLLPETHLCLSLSPDAADSTSFDVQLGDIILTATDGLFDNMPDYMILQELKKLKVSDKHVCRRIRKGHDKRLMPALFGSSEHKLWEHSADGPQHRRAGPCVGLWPQLHVTFRTVCLWQWTECKR